MLKLCDYCGEEFEAQRKTARFCCPSHRSQYRYCIANGRPLAVQTRTWLFETQHRENLKRVSDNLSKTAVDGLIALVEKYGPEVGEMVLWEVVAPLYNAHVDEWLGVHPPPQS